MRREPRLIAFTSTAGPLGGPSRPGARRRLFRRTGVFRMNPSPPTTLTPVAARVRALAEEAVGGTALYVVDVAVRGSEGNRVVEVYADADAGAGLNDLAELSRRLSFALDAEDVVPGRYRLDVSSPGADRPLVLPRQFRRHVGRALRVSYGPVAGDPGEEVTATGTLAAAGPDALRLDVAGQDKPAEIPYAAIRDARIVLPW